MSTPESSDRHHGTFASGESSPEIYPDEKEIGTFAKGEDNPEAHSDETEVGTFASGEDSPEAYPDEKEIGTFALRRGQPRSLSRRQRSRADGTQLALFGSQRPQRAPCRGQVASATI
jgi:hypothetical protein